MSAASALRPSAELSASIHNQSNQLFHQKDYDAERSECHALTTLRDRAYDPGNPDRQSIATNQYP
jgi:hypothetical protein